MRYVIIGNSAAAIGCIEGIRQVDKCGEIFILSSEPYHTYSRPLISYLLLGKVTEEKMRYRETDFYKKYTVQLIFKSAVHVNSKDKQVTLSDGSFLAYDKLLVATGSSPFVPPFAGLDTVENKFTFMCIDDAKRLEASLGKDKNVLIVGAGLIGLKCAEGIHGKVKGITVVDLAPRILSSILDEDGANRVQKHIEKQDIEFKLGLRVERFLENTAILSNGESLNFDVLVLAVGVRPNTKLLSGVAAIDKGIVIDNRCETSVNDIYAAGDCTQTTDISCGQNKILALLPNAYMQGECVGVNMAGGQKTFDKALPMNAIGFFGLHLITAGSYMGSVYNEADSESFKKLYYESDRLKGYILIGNVERAGIYTSLIREQVPLSTIDFDLICKKPGLVAFAKKDREMKLGGQV